MQPSQFEIVKGLINLPTAPFVEYAGLDHIKAFVKARSELTMREDRFGNLLVHYKRGPKPPRGTRPLLFAGHLDHPGFIAERMEDTHTVYAAWRGWVRPEFFPKAGVRFWSGGKWQRGTVIDIVPGNTPRGMAKPVQRKVASGQSAKSFGAESPPSAARIRVSRAIEPGAPGMWDFPDARVAGTLLKTRACDDVVGVAGILCMLDEICRKRVRGECYAFFTRAEEVGFGGALAACADGFVPKNAIVIAIECSKAITGVELGAGPVLRVGDKASVFTPAATAYCQVVAEDLARTDATFKFQRKLMDGGTCESTVYCHYGYDATGICLPLRNYHNMDEKAGVVAPEIIDMRDLENLVRWFVALVLSRRPYDGAHPGLGARLESLLAKHTPMLLKTKAPVDAAKRSANGVTRKVVKPRRNAR